MVDRPAGGGSVPTISTHVLDAGAGRPAAGVAVTLSRIGQDGRPIRLTQALTDDDGRIRDLLERPLVAGTYRLEVDLAGRAGLFARAALDFRVEDAARSHHIPFLIAPYSLTSYRGT